MMLRRQKKTPKVNYEEMICGMQSNIEFLSMCLEEEKLRKNVSRQYAESIVRERDNFLRRLRAKLTECGTEKAIEMINEELGGE